jgi:hypothetical protein
MGLHQGPGGEWLVGLGEGFTVPAHGQFTVPGSTDFMYDVTIRFRWWEGRFDAVEVNVCGLEDFSVTGEVLRKVPIARLLREHLATTVKGPRPPGRADGVDHDNLLRVATIYRIAYMAYEPPVQAVAEQLGIAPSTAAKKVIQARRTGLLPPTTPGKARAGS